MEDPAALLDNFNDAFKDLQDHIQSKLLDKPLIDALANCTNDLERATTQVTLAYIIYDLIWIYLRTRGIDPMQHAVIDELDRIKQYFAKIQKAEESGQKMPQQMKVDKEAASRFIKAAINSGLSQSSELAPVRPEPKRPQTYEVGTSSRFQHFAAEAEARKEDSDEEILQVVDSSASVPEKKRRRKQKEPAANQDEPTEVVGEEASAAPTPTDSKKKKKKKKRKHLETDDANEPSAHSHSQASASRPNSESPASEKKKRKKKHSKSNAEP